ncbi:hypothetical protein BGZ54_007429, partial [Gamsiella multidivaricata]
FHLILFRHVPPHKIYFSKKVLSLNQTSESAQVRCSDNSVFYADIVIGADGAYSGIRQSLYRSIQNAPRNVAQLGRGGLASAFKKRSSNGSGGGGVGHKGDIRLPKSDQEPLRFDQHAVVGLTNLGPRETPSEQELAAKGLSANFKVSEWGPESVDKILDLDYVKNQKSPYGGTMQDIFDQTEKGSPVRIMLEDKAFKTWYYKRTVLVGDACHKTIPFSGVGALHAILDCITLANALYDMPDGNAFTLADINQAFQTYYAQRVESAAAAVKGSAQVSQFLSRTSAVGHMIRKATIASMPESMIMIAADRIFAKRPILSYLPFIPDYGARKSVPQSLGRRDREELEMLRGKQRQQKAEEVLRQKEEKQRKVASSPRSGRDLPKDSANRILHAATASSFGSSPSERSSPLPRHNFLSENTSGRSVVSSSLTPSTASMDRFAVSGESENIPPNQQEFIVSNSDQWLESDAASDSASMFSFSSRYTLPYDAEELASQYYSGRRAIYPYVDPGAAAHNAGERASTGSVMSALWRKYGIRGTESSASLASSSASSRNITRPDSITGIHGDDNGQAEHKDIAKAEPETSPLRNRATAPEESAGWKRLDQEFKEQNARALAYYYDIGSNDAATTEHELPVTVEAAELSDGQDQSRVSTVRFGVQHDIADQSNIGVKRQ